MSVIMSLIMKEILIMNLGGLLMAEALGALHKTSLLIHMPNAKRVALGEQPRDQDSIEREARYVSSMSS